MEWCSDAPTTMVVTLKHHVDKLVYVGYTEFEDPVSALNTIRARAASHPDAADLHRVLFGIGAKANLSADGTLTVTTSRGTVTSWFVRKGLATLWCCVWSNGPDHEGVVARATFADEVASI